MRLKMRGVLGCLLVLAGSVAAAQTGAERAGGVADLPKLEHIDVTLVDTKGDPCANFYQYACGKLNESSPIPPDQIAWGAGGKLQEWNRTVLRRILEQAEVPSASRTPNQQKIGDFFASCMEQKTDGAAALSPFAPLLKRIDGMSNKSELAAVLAEMHRSIGTAWEGNDNQTAAPIFGFGPTPDYNDVSRVVASLDQGGLGLPSRDFYLREDARSKEIRAAYQAFVAKTLAMSGVSESQAKQGGAAVMAFETALAKAQMDNIARRDPAKTNNRLTLEQVKALTPSFGWDTYLKGVDAPAVPLYEVSSPDFFRALETELKTVDLPVWKVYLRWWLLHQATPVLGPSWRQANFDFTKMMSGAKALPPDWRRCTGAVDHYLGEALGQVYVAQVFPPESKARAKKLVADIEAAMQRDIQSVGWMEPKTKQEAERKLAAIVDKIGYPDRWRDYGSLRVTRESFPGNVEEATRFEARRQMQKIGKPLDRLEWVMTPPTVDAYEDPQTNTINFPAGILQPIYFDPTEDDVINYGSEGAVVGHELTHGFDDQGRKFDEKGNLRDWWTASDTKNYDERGSCVAKEYTGPVPGVADVQQDGRLTQGEDTADNGGLYLALSALEADLKGQGKTIEDKDAHGLTNMQRFFLAYGNSWCETIRPEAMRTYLISNPHSMPELRVNNVVSNMPEFKAAFGCKTGQPMVHATQCRVW